MNSATERNLVHKAQTGDTQAFAELVQAHQLFAYNVALRAVNNSQDAEDIVQEAFVKAWKSLSRFRLEAKFRTWLYRIVMNLCYNQLPKLRKELRSLEQGNGQVQLVETNPEMNPAAHLEGKETIAFVHQQIKSLPSQHQILLMLRYQQGCSYTEISEILDLPLGTVKTGIFRARERLKEVVYHLQKEWVRL